MSTYAIGDIHGCLKELSELLWVLTEQEKLQPEDKLVFVGDYVDRGPEPKGVVDFLIQLSKTQNCVFLKGNHEDMMLDYLGVDGHHGSVWIMNGGEATLNSYGLNSFNSDKPCVAASLPQEHLDFLQNLKYYHIEGSVLFVHAGVTFTSLNQTTPEGVVLASKNDDLVWDRDTFMARNQFGTMVYGHTPNKKGIRWNLREQDGPFDGAPYSVGVDVGCVFGCNPLTAVRIDDWQEIRPD